MCGIALIYRPSGGLESELLQPALHSLAARGPDGSGIWLDPQRRCVLGHTRLAVMDPGSGAQPMTLGPWTIAANGEIYGSALREELERSGARFRTHSDSELLLHGAAHWGKDMFERLNAELCAVVFNHETGKLWAYRDRYGARTLVYAWHHGSLYLASTSAALFALGVPRAWDEAAMSLALGMQYLPPERTPFAGVHMLPPGHLFELDGKRLDVQPWGMADWDSPSDSKSTESHDVQSFREVFLASVERRLRSDARVCFHLSGGIDSAAVLGAAAELQRQGRASTEPLVAFTASFPGSPLDELELARSSAAQVGARCEVVSLSPLDLVQGLAAAAHAGEGLAVNGHLVAHQALDRAISAAGFKSVLSGEGADELLYGYPHLRADLGALAQEYPEGNGLEQAVRGLMLAERPELTNAERLARLDPHPLKHQLGCLPTFLQAKLQLGARLCSLTHDGWRSRAQTALGTFFGRPEVSSLRGRAAVDVAATLWTRLALGGYILPTLSDRLLGAHGLESRLPFLDPDLYRLMRRLPIERRIRRGEEKWLLREAVRGWVPEAIRTRRKHPFLAPSLTEDAGARRALRELLREDAFSAGTFFDIQRVQRRIEALEQAPAELHRAWGPPLFLVATAHALGRAFGLEAK
ncbi:MAG: asparagine synthase (glutamine-hydrolyzing) [Myxococcales bacterium]|nr:asparagine synthase (glutamine-hydrolyzing) [Myxococcales bacterium]